MSVSNDKVDLFAQYCVDKLNLESIRYDDEYQSLSVCILDCIYSLRAHYYSCAVPLLNRYAARFLHGDRFAPNETLTDFIGNIEIAGGCVDFANNLLKNRQVLNGVLKSEVCYNLAQKLISININTLQDFQTFQDIDLLENTILSVRGVGYAALNYLFMLAGDPNRCKPDVHIHRCVKEALTCDINDRDCQDLFSQVIVVLNKKYPQLTIRKLDYTIWNIFQARK
ncbi:MAG: hypothetical protein J1G02_03010 [Clostridiales bacterium]|nr:hypothetical protein [Clostridiales bacterium]